ncbi:CCR4-NOT transcription complex subunit 1 [Rhizoctonia solani]|uniref:CCR4-NOT transcription complex subunit 1 n=1 Tax=Rhizoctonia solani TaxID=456999 RepID=A0A0K6GDD9_9AGAM|nr:CCR4-NOT transcription complex subunit 1 [Rhizoctonia solani]
MLPVLMHVALAFFLIGLIFFLEELNNHIWKAALSVTVLAAMVYLLMTLAPLFIPFCPYSTPLSSPKLWGYISQWLPAVATYVYGFFFETKLRPDFAIHSSRCERQQHEISNNTMPDEITGDALNWIILHTPDSETRDMAIRSISSLKSEKTLKQLVVDPPGILPQVIQSFTSCFPMRASPQEDNKAIAGVNTDTVALYAQALLVLMNGIMHSPGNFEFTSLTISAWGIDSETVTAVEKRLQLLSSSDSLSAGIAGLTGLSAWRRFVGYTHLPDDHSELLVRLSQQLTWELPQDSCSDILHSILVESAHWTPKFQGNQRTQLLSRLVDLICDPSPNNSDKWRAKLICSLAVLTLGLNQGQTRLRLPFRSNRFDTETYITHDHAQSIVSYYIQNPGRILGDEPPLLLLALAGLIEYYEHRVFDELSSDNIAKIAPLLLTLDIFGRFQTVALPPTVWLNADLRDYFVEVVANYFRRAPDDDELLTNSANGTLSTDGMQNTNGERPEHSPRVHATMHILHALVNNTTFWKDITCVHALRGPILHVWSRSNDTSMRVVCLKAIASNLERTHLTSYVNMLFAFDVPYKLVELMRTQEIVNLRTPIAMIFGLLSEDARSSSGQGLNEHNKSLDFVTRVLLGGLLQPFVRYVLSTYSHEYNAYGKYWGGVILDAVKIRLTNHRTRDEKLQETYNYLEKGVDLGNEGNENSDFLDFINRLLTLMNDGNKELKKDYIRPNVPKVWLNKLEDFRNAGEQTSPGAGPSSV